jgi:hypothetical protein
MIPRSSLFCTLGWKERGANPIPRYWRGLVQHSLSNILVNYFASFWYICKVRVLSMELTVSLRKIMGFES